MKFLVGILNSKLIAFWVKSNGKQQGALLKLDKVPLQEIPLPVVNDTQQQPIIALADQILSVKQANPSADTKDLEDKIDRLVYQLYGLTEEEIKIVEQSSASK